MPHAEPARRSREDVRAFAEAFALDDDVFAPASRRGESRTLTLAELGDELAGVRTSLTVVPDTLDGVPGGESYGGLLTLDELGEALARTAPAADTGGLDFDFGSGTAERARRRTAARLGHAPALPRRTSGPAAPPLPRGTSGPTAAPAAAPQRHLVLVTAAAEAGRVPEPGPAALTLDDVAAQAVALAAQRSGHGEWAPAPRRRSSPSFIERLHASPDRIALWAVVLGLVLIVIAAASAGPS